MKVKFLFPMAAGLLLSVALVTGACGDGDETDTGGDGATEAATNGAGESSLGTYMN